MGDFLKNWGIFKKLWEVFRDNPCFWVKNEGEGPI
jgi:hypothetical protein